MLSRVSTVLVCALVLQTNAALVAATSGDEKINAKVEELLGRMTLDEKIGQLTQVGGKAFFPNAPKAEDTVRKGLAGSILWLSEPADINRLQKIAVEQTRLHIPLIFGLDVIHGFRTLFPMPTAATQTSATAAWGQAPMSAIGTAKSTRPAANGSPSRR